MKVVIFFRKDFLVIEKHTQTPVIKNKFKYVFSQCKFYNNYLKIL